MFDTEVLEKTDDLMKKFDLATVAEPKREDYVKVRKEVAPVKSPERRDKRSPRRDRRGSRSPGRRGGGRNYSSEDKRTVRDVGYDFDSRPGGSRDGREVEVMGSFGPDGKHEPGHRGGSHRNRDVRPGHNRNTSPGDKGGGTRNPSPPGAGRARMHDQGRTGPNRMD